MPMLSSPSSSSFVPLETVEQLDLLVTESTEQPVAIFKHSPTCGTSAQAFDELASLLGEGTPVPIHLVNVVAGRMLSRQIAERFGLRHESPQLLLIHRGQVRWHASHWRVTATEVRRAAAALATSL